MHNASSIWPNNAGIRKNKGSCIHIVADRRIFLVIAILLLHPTLSEIEKAAKRGNDCIIL